MNHQMFRLKNWFYSWIPMRDCQYCNSDDEVKFDINGEILTASPRRRLEDSSPVFGKILYSEFKESQDNVIKITDADFENFEILVNYCTRGSLDPAVLPEDITAFITLVKLAHRFQVASLVQSLEIHLIQSSKLMKPDTALVWTELAHVLGLGRLKYHSLVAVGRSARYFLLDQTTQLVELSTRNLDILVEILSMSRFYVKEELIFKFVQKLALQNGKDSANHYLSVVRWELLDKGFVAQMAIENGELFQRIDASAIISKLTFEPNYRYYFRFV